MLIDKNALPQVAIQSMNDTHTNEVELINALFDLITRKRGGEDVDAQLSEMVDSFDEHVKQHFHSEEVLMQQTGFPAYQVHKGEHDRVLEEIAVPVAAWRERADIEPLGDYLQNVHPQWAQNHIVTMDTMTAFFIAENSA